MSPDRKQPQTSDEDRAQLAEAKLHVAAPETAPEWQPGENEADKIRRQLEEDEEVAKAEADAQDERLERAFKDHLHEALRLAEKLHRELYGDDEQE